MKALQNALIFLTVSLLLHIDCRAIGVEEGNYPSIPDTLIKDFIDKNLGDKEARAARCKRFDISLAPKLRESLEGLQTTIESLDEADFKSSAGEDLRRKYVHLLSQYEDAQTSPPLECQLFVSVPSQIEFAAVSVRVAFLTDRQLEVDSFGRSTFGEKRSESGFSVGIVQANLLEGGICKAYPEGREGFSLTTMSGYGNAFFISNQKILALNELADIFRKYRQATSGKPVARALLFVHGFNVSFKDAIIAAGEIANCMDSAVAPIVFSWPSAGKILSYLEDEEAVSASRERLRTAFAWLAQRNEFDEVIIVAHSMGTRLVARLLADLQLQGKSFSRLKRIVFAAADLGEEEFLEFWPRVRSLSSDGWTFYVARNDLALWASTAAHRRPRIGDSRKRVFSVAQADTIDATGANPAAVGYGHAYLMRSSSVIRDIRDWVIATKTPKTRGLLLRKGSPVDYWVISH